MSYPGSYFLNSGIKQVCKAQFVECAVVGPIFRNSHCPQTANENWHSVEGDTATVSCDGVAHLDRFPLVRIASLRVGRRSAATIAQENVDHGRQNVLK